MEKLFIPIINLFMRLVGREIESAIDRKERREKEKKEKARIKAEKLKAKAAANLERLLAAQRANAARRENPKPKPDVKPLDPNPY